jgi:hypothetical protein
MRRTACQLVNGLRVVGFALAALIILTGRTVRADEPVQPALSMSEIRSLRQVARDAPCAVITALYLRQNQADAPRGELFLEHIPSAEDIRSLLDRSSAQIQQEVTLWTRMNPYSSASFYLRVGWTRVAIREGYMLVTTSADLVDRTGKPFTPPHSIEAAQVLQAQGSFHLLSQSPTTL